MYKYGFALLGLVSWLGGCQLTNQARQEQWYMRSEITWWEARPEFVLQHKEDTDLMTVPFTMIADGNSYHIKVTDKMMSKDKNCGRPANGVIRLQINTWQPLECQYLGDDITPLAMAYQFIPLTGASYLLEVRLVSGVPSELRVRVAP